MSPSDWLLLVTLSILWGASFFFVEIALVDFGPLTIVLGRVGFAALMLLAWVYLSGRRMPFDAGTWGAFLVMGALNNLIPFSLITWGQIHITSGLASILNATTPLFTVLLAHLLTKDDRLTPGRAVGVLFGFVGVVILFGPTALSGLGAAGLAQMAILGAALSYGFAGLYGRRLRRLPTSVAAAGMLCGSTLLVIPLAWFLEGPFPLDVAWQSFGAILGSALLCTALAYLIYFRVLARAGATNLLLVTFMIPPSALILGVVVLSETLRKQDLVGMAIIFLGLAAIDGRPWAMLRARLQLQRS